MKECPEKKTECIWWDGMACGWDGVDCVLDAEKAPIALLEITSMHEQRERFGTPEIVVRKDVWLEVIDFDPHTERAEIIRRYNVEKVEAKQEGDIRRYRITLQKLNVEEDQDAKEEMAKKIIEKHHTNMKMSFAKCLVDGIDLKSIPELKNMLLKMRGDMNGNKQKDS